MIPNEYKYLMWCVCVCAFKERGLPWKSVAIKHLSGVCLSALHLSELKIQCCHILEILNIYIPQLKQNMRDAIKYHKRIDQWGKKGISGMDAFYSSQHAALWDIQETGGCWCWSASCWGLWHERKGSIIQTLCDTRYPGKTLQKYLWRLLVVQCGVCMYFYSRSTALSWNWSFTIRTKRLLRAR